MRLEVLASNENLLKLFHSDGHNISKSIEEIKLWITTMVHSNNTNISFDAIKYIASYPNSIKTYFDGYTFNADLALYTYIVYGYVNSIPKCIPQNLKKKKIVFYVYTNILLETNKLRVTQLSKYLRNFDNLDIQIVSNIKNDLKNAIVIITKIRFKSYNPKELINTITQLKQKQNIIVLDIIDSFVEKEMEDLLRNKKIIMFLRLFDIILCTSYHQKNIMSRYLNQSLLHVLYHQWDEDLWKHKVSSNINTEIFYVGHPKKLDFTCAETLEKHKVQKSGLTDKIYNSFHFTYVPSSNIYFDTHTSTKLATAAVTNSVFICNRIPVFCELLPYNYPFFADNIKEIDNILTFVKSIPQPTYNKYFSMIKDIRNRLSPRTIANDLYVILKPFIYLR